MRTEGNFSVEGRTAVITGGTGVLGSTLAKGLATASANVVILGRKKEVGNILVSNLKNSNHSALFVEVDVLDVDQLKRANGVILKEYGKIDILVNAAGGNLSGANIGVDQSFFDLNVSEFRNVVDLNLTGTLLPTKIFCADMIKRKQGVVVNIASMASYKPLTRVVGYSASKAAVKNFTEWLAIEMSKKFGEGIRVNAIAPGFFITSQNKSLLTNADGSLTQRGKDAIKQTPFNRFGNPEELIGTLLWLCSDASKFVTGVTVPVDGGFQTYCGV